VQDDVRIEHRQQRLEVAPARGRQKRADQRLLVPLVGLRGHPPELDPTTRAARQLPGRHRRAPHDRRDVVERKIEHVVEDERHPLGRRQRLQHHQQGDADRVGEQQLALGPRRQLGVGGTGVSIGARDQVGRVAVGGLLAPGLAGAQHVQADARHHGRQPAAEVIDRTAVGPAEPQPGLLNRVVRLPDGAQHPMGDPPQVVPMGFEAVCQALFQVLFQPFSQFFFGHRHIPFSLSVIGVTVRQRPM
jgi:hypothetical protein